MRYAGHLQRSHKWENIYINPDLSKEERQAGKLLRQELDKYKKNGGRHLLRRLFVTREAFKWKDLMKTINRMARRHDSNDADTEGQPRHKEMTKNEIHQTRPQDNEALPKDCSFGRDMAGSVPNLHSSGSCESGGNQATGNAASTNADQLPNKKEELELLVEEHNLTLSCQTFSLTTNVTHNAFIYPR